MVCARRGLTRPWTGTAADRQETVHTTQGVLVSPPRPRGLSLIATSDGNAHGNLLAGALTAVLNACGLATCVVDLITDVEADDADHVSGVASEEGTYAVLVGSHG